MLGTQHSSSLPSQACLHLYQPHRRCLMLPRAPCWPQPHCPHGEATAAAQGSSSPWGCTFLSWDQILKSSTGCPGTHAQGHTPRDTHPLQALRRLQTPPHTGEGCQKGYPVHRAAAVNPTDFAPPCGDGTIKAEPLGTRREPSTRAELWGRGCQGCLLSLLSTAPQQGQAPLG